MARLANNPAHDDFQGHSSRAVASTGTAPQIGGSAPLLLARLHVLFRGLRPAHQLAACGALLPGVATRMCQSVSSPSLPASPPGREPMGRESDSRAPAPSSCR